MGMIMISYVLTALEFNVFQKRIKKFIARKIIIKNI